MLRKSKVYGRAAIFAAAVVFAQMATQGAFAATTAPTINLMASPAPDEPFGLMTDGIFAGPLYDKWQAAFAAINSDIAAVSACQSQAASCVASAAELQLSSMSESAHDRVGLARIGTVNRAVNLAIRPVSDQAQYGVDDFWAAPLKTLASGAGDCEDYAIAKLATLRLAGVNESDLRLVIVRNLIANEDHAVAAVRLDSEWYLLDNRHMMLVKDNDLDGYRPLFVLAFDGVRRFTEPMLVANLDHAPPPVAFATDDAMRLASASFLSIPAFGTGSGDYPAVAAIQNASVTGTL